MCSCPSVSICVNSGFNLDWRRHFVLHSLLCKCHSMKNYRFYLRSYFIVDILLHDVLRQLYRQYAFQEISHDALLLIMYLWCELILSLLLVTGFPLSTITVMFVTYCLVQVIKERERKQALIDHPDPVPPPAPAPPPTTIKPQTEAPDTAVDPSKEKSE